MHIPTSFSEFKKLSFEERMEIFRLDPALRHLEQVLLRIGGTRVALRPDPDVELVLRRAKPVSGEGAKMVRGAPSDCHRNTAALWRKRRQHGFRIVTGWALSDDGCWRQHSWGAEDGRIIETTLGREIYFGAELDDLDAARFCSLVAPELAPQRHAPRPGGDLVKRAIKAYLRSGGVDQPANTSGIETHGGDDYVVLRNCRGVLAVYRVRGNGRLSGMKEIPDWANASVARRRRAA